MCHLFTMVSFIMTAPVFSTVSSDCKDFDHRRGYAEENLPLHIYCRLIQSHFNNCVSVKLIHESFLKLVGQQDDS